MKKLDDVLDADYTVNDSTPKRGGLMSAGIPWIPILCIIGVLICGALIGCLIARILWVNDIIPQVQYQMHYWEPLHQSASLSVF
jgi:hypothetical protein